MASQNDPPRKPATQPKQTRKLHTDKAPQDKAKQPAPPKKDAPPVVFQDWASI